MSYIITASSLDTSEYRIATQIAMGVASSVAVEDIEHARAAILADLGDRGYIGGPQDDLCGQVLDLTESGGTITVLPSGYVIEVRPIEWQSLAEIIGLVAVGIDVLDTSLTRADIIDAYNAAHG